MTTWTDTAQQQLARYFEQIRTPLRASGADPDEVSDDLRRHIDEEVVARKLKVVTEEDVRHILARIGAPETPPKESNHHLNPESPSDIHSRSQLPLLPGDNPERGWKNRPGAWLLLVFSIILPSVTLGIELLTHMCAGVFFDPIPTLWHAMLVAAVPAANLWAWLSLRNGQSRFGHFIGWSNGFAIGVAAFYSVAYLPLLPFALIGLFYLGWGLLPMAPLLALIGAFVLRGRLRRLPSVGVRLPGFWPGMALAVVALLWAVLPATATRFWAREAASESPTQRARAVRWLRAIGSERTLLGDCYGSTAWSRRSAIPIQVFGTAVAPEQARQTYLRVTGQPFNAVPPPQLNFTRGGWDWLDEFTWDAEQGGRIVGNRLRGLSLVGSRLDGLVEADAALAYVEWTMEFRNVWRQPHEARAQIALPPGGAVSRLALWVNGEEREAAFAGCGEVRKAYEKVAIHRRRDPVLVTSDGPDRVLVQCFPVPADGGTLKIRIGITAPLVLDSLASGVLQWPHFLERNFSLAEDFVHSLWVESQATLECAVPRLTAERSPASRNALRGNLDDLALPNPGAALRVRRSPAVTRVWTADSAGDGAVEQEFVQATAKAPSRIVLVLDGSRAMQGEFPAIARALGALPDGTELSLLVAADEVLTPLGTPQRLTQAIRQELSRQLGNLKAAGGQGNVPALLQAFDLAAPSTDGVILWIHGPQPVLLDDADPLAQRFLWRGAQTRFFDFQTVAGPNRIAEKLNGTSGVKCVPRLGSVADDLTQLFKTLSGQTPVIELARRRLSGPLVNETATVRQVSRHLARLWAVDEVTRLVAGRFREAAVALAGKYQIVTPVSGAVVLETAQQFAEAGLRPVSAESVPSVPEPETLWWIMGGIGLVYMVCVRRNRRRPRVPRNA